MTPSGIQVTRNHPPIEGKDSPDHDTFHPGIWLTFAGINGNDYWRLKQKTEHEMYVGEKESGPGKGSFTVSNFYLDKDGKRIAHETCKYTIIVRRRHYLLIYDSTISSDEHDLVFGDDQEYGLGIRVQTPIEERYGGQILNADGNKGRKGVARGEPSEVKVKKGEKFHLGFGVAIYSAPKDGEVNRTRMYRGYLRQIGAQKQGEARKAGDARKKAGAAKKEQ
jgi:hypothetical protein